MSKTIVSISGPESSGKTTLAIELARHLGCAYLPEIARFYLKDRVEYRFEDVEEIAQLQLEAVQRAKVSGHSDFLVLDSDHVVLEVWFLEKFNRLPSAWEAYKAAWEIDLHVLCRPDIPWEPDPLRENPFDRDRLFDRYHELLVRSDAHFTTAEGTPEQRLQAVLSRL